MADDEGTYDDGYSDGKSDGRNEAETEAKAVLNTIIDVLPSRYQRGHSGRDSMDEEDWQAAAEKMEEIANGAL